MNRIYLLKLAACALLPCLAAAAVPVTNPQLTGPVTGGDHGAAFGALPADDLTRAGYSEAEYFYGGTATAYGNEGTWGIDGVWPAKPTTAADYKVRMLVLRPTDAKRFNGVVVMEWLNVTALQEGAADFIQMREELFREGYAWVGLGVQAAGVNTPKIALKAWDPTRYGSLQHPGDNYAYDIFSQGAQAIRHPKGTDPLGGLRVRYMLGVGRSQSAAFMIGYLNAVHPLTERLYDGYLIHSRVGGVYGFPDNLKGIVPANPHIRTDLDVPVLDLQMEGDYVALRSHLARQEDSKHFRLWEVAGGAHSETPRWVVEVPPALDHSQNCKDPINAAPGHAVVKASLHALLLWVRDNKVPPKSPLLELGDPAAPDPILRDKYGNAKGGIRLPEVDVPTATVNGLPNSPADPKATLNFCRLFGTTVPFEKGTLLELYPTHDSFVKPFDKAVDSIEKAGFWLKPEADEAKKAATASSIGR